ncbi:hypothetical protein B0H17DRAFT_1063457 [Mycena rosella]|uniref:Uncharacterized protein n=1 Tax=Mycena rosella TaxID=1033263 RepID=A0AAD7DHD3_MYCRO|nr:hypothetical protein B0H17DRAFT_1063457 [Mycena rosella]
MRPPALIVPRTLTLFSPTTRSCDAPRLGASLGCNSTTGRNLRVGTHRGNSLQIPLSHCQLADPDGACAHACQTGRSAEVI